MAIDTETKRRSILNTHFHRGSSPLPKADGNIDAANRAALSGVYAGDFPDPDLRKGTSTAARNLLLLLAGDE